MWRIEKDRKDASTTRQAPNVPDATECAPLRGGSAQPREPAFNSKDSFPTEWILAGEADTDGRLSDSRDQPQSRRKVLIADDYADAADSLAVLLTVAGYTTRVAYDGEEALALACAWQPQVCVLDVGMPKLDGFQLTQQIRGHLWGKACVLVAVTGWVSERHRLAAEVAGFDCYLAKPVDPVKLLQAINAERENARITGMA